MKFDMCNKHFLLSALLVSALGVFSSTEGIAEPAASVKNSSSFSYDMNSSEPVIVYHNVVHMLKNRDEQPMLKIYGNGLVQVHHPVYTNNAGDYEMQLSQQELGELLESLSDDGLMAFDDAKVKQKKKDMDRIKSQRGELYYISDSVTTEIQINLKKYKPANSAINHTNFKKRIRLKDIEQDLKQYKSIDEIQKTGKGINKLKSLLSRNELKRK